MSPTRTRLPLALLLALLAVTPSVGADDEKVKQDLTAVIALQGKPCGQVVAFERRGENDYMVTCRDGSRYHVFVNPQGRVVVDRR